MHVVPGSLCDLLNTPLLLPTLLDAPPLVTGRSSSSSQLAFEVVQLAVLFAFPDLHPSVAASTPVAGFPLPVSLSLSLLPSLCLSVCQEGLAEEDASLAAC